MKICRCGENPLLQIPRDANLNDFTLDFHFRFAALFLSVSDSRRHSLLILSEISYKGEKPAAAGQAIAKIEGIDRHYREMTD